MNAAITLFARLRSTPLRRWATLELSLAEAAALYGLAFLLSAALGIVRQALLNARFGLGPEASAYYAAARLPDTVAMLVAGGTLTNAMVPVLLGAQARGGEAAVARVVNLALSALLVVFAPLCVACALLAPLFVRTLLAPGFEPAIQTLTAALTRIMLLEVLLVISEAALVAVLVSRNQVILPCLAIVVRNFTLIGGTLFATLVPEVGIYGPTIGSILDALLQLAVLVPGLRQRGYRPQRVWQPTDPDLRAVGRLLGPNAISTLCSYGGGILDTAFVSLSGVFAAVGALVNASLLFGMPVRLLGIAVGQAALPRLAALEIAGKRAAIRATLRATLLVSGGLAVLAGLALIVFGRTVIGLLFERGAFDAAAADLTYSLLAIYALGLPAYVATEVATRALAARADTRTPMLTNLLQIAARAALLVFLIEPLGPAAIPTAYAATSTIEAAVLVAALRWRSD